MLAFGINSANPVGYSVLPSLGGHHTFSQFLL